MATRPAPASLWLVRHGESVGNVAATQAELDGAEVIDLDLTVKIPLVGGKIEQLIAEIFSHALDVEQKVGREWLGR